MEEGTRVIVEEKKAECLQGPVADLERMPFWKDLARAAAER